MAEWENTLPVNLKLSFPYTYYYNMYFRQVVQKLK
jgi:hypothetical protein